MKHKIVVELDCDNLKDADIIAIEVRAAVRNYLKLHAPEMVAEIKYSGEDIPGDGLIFRNPK